MSSNESTVLAYHLTKSGGDRLRQMVASAPRARLIELVASSEEFEHKAVQVQPDILLVEFDSQAGGLADLLGRLRRSLPASFLVVQGESQEPEVILSAMRLGAREYLPASDGECRFAEAVSRLWSETAASAQPTGSLLSLMGVKGGVGTSSLVLSLAWIASQKLGVRTALIDLDLAKGDLASLLDRDARRGLAQVVDDFDRLDSLLLDSLLPEVEPGLRFMAAPGDAVLAEEIKGIHVERTLEHLQANHELVLADLPPRLDESGLAALDRSDLVLLVSEPTVLGLKALRRMLDLCKGLGHGQDKIKVVINRYGAKQCVPAREVEKVINAQPLAYLPNDSATLMQAANSGVPAPRDWPRSKWCKEVVKLAGPLVATHGGGK